MEMIGAAICRAAMIQAGLEDLRRRGRFLGDIDQSEGPHNQTWMLMVMRINSTIDFVESRRPENP